MEFLSDDWVSALSARVARVPVPAGARPLVLQLHVTGGPGGDVDYHVTLSSQGGRAATGRAASPTVRFSQDWETACAVHAGGLTPQEAVLSGRLRVEGAVTELVGWTDVLAAIERDPVA